MKTMLRTLLKMSSGTFDGKLEDGQPYAYRFLVLVKSVGIGLLLVISSALGAQETVHGQSRGASFAWTFDDVGEGKLPEGWKTEGTNQHGPVAMWMVKKDASAPSKPKVLALTDPKEGWGGTFNLAWTDRVRFENGAVEVKVKGVTGREDQGGGPLWRVQDRNNYYVARWNPLERNYRLYYVKDGRRVQLASAEVDADPTRWHTIRIAQKGDEITCYFDGKQLLKVTDKTFSGAGGVGLWTKADAVTFFDDLTVHAEAR